MKHLVKLFVVTFICLICTYSLAEQKIAFIDMKFILNKSKAGEGAQKYLKSTVEKDQKEFIEIEKSLKKDENDLLKKKATLSKEEYEKKTDELRKRVVNYQNNRRSALSKLAKKRADARALLLKKIDPIIDSYIKEQGIVLVIDRKDIIRASKDLDITNIIVEKLNKELPSLNLK